MVKLCSKCKVEKNIEDFYTDKRNKTGLTSCCKVCKIERNRLYRKTEEGKKSLQKYLKSIKHKKCNQKYDRSINGKKTRAEYEQTEKCKKYRKEYRQTENGKEVQRKSRSTEHYKEYQREYKRGECKNDLSARLAYRLRSRIYNALNGRGEKSLKTIELIGCSIETLKEHLEKQFIEGMTWENWGKGKGKWNIDHIVPCASFELANIEEQKKCFHYTNQQPLWEEENLRKHSNV